MYVLSQLGALILKTLRSRHVDAPWLLCAALVKSANREKLSQPDLALIRKRTSSVVGMIETNLTAGKLSSPASKSVSAGLMLSSSLISPKRCASIRARNLRLTESSWTNCYVDQFG